MSDEIKKGLVGVISDETKVSKVMPEINSLTYRGYAVQDLAEECSFEEVAYLLLYGELPNTKQLKKFEKEERKNRDTTNRLSLIYIMQISLNGPDNIGYRNFRWRFYKFNAAIAASDRYDKIETYQFTGNFHKMIF